MFKTSLLEKELETNNLIRPYRQKELGDDKEKIIREIIKTYAEVLVKDGDCFSKETAPYFEKSLDRTMIYHAPVDLAYFKAGQRSGLIQSINEYLSADDKLDVDKDERYLKLNEEAEQLSESMYVAIQALCANYLIDLAIAGLITFNPQEAE